MKQEAKTLRERVAQLLAEFEKAQKVLRDAEHSVEMMENRCRHDYTPPTYEPIHHEGYTFPGDPPGTMGVDWRGPVYVPSSTEKRWRRECKLCGKVEYTTRIKEEKTEVPDW